MKNSMRFATATTCFDTMWLLWWLGHGVSSRVNVTQTRILGADSPKTHRTATRTQMTKSTFQKIRRVVHCFWLL